MMVAGGRNVEKMTQHGEGEKTEETLIGEGGQGDQC
jgi:hypothetical protein